MKVVRLKGSSMWPVFRPGRSALVSVRRPRTGDCAVYDFYGRVLLHRVIKTAQGGAWLADDAGRLKPHFVPWARIRGKALGGPLSGGLSGLAYSRLRRAISSVVLRR